ncbi:MAG: hypothetical protein ACO20O_12415, partial [Pseudomonadales bacterium]
ATRTVVYPRARNLALGRGWTEEVGTRPVAEGEDDAMRAARRRRDKHAALEQIKCARRVVNATSRCEGVIHNKT